MGLCGSTYVAEEGWPHAFTPFTFPGGQVAPNRLLKSAMTEVPRLR